MRYNNSSAQADKIESHGLKAVRAFTLVEVLAVVAIIALLVAILLPALRAARDMARASVAAQNMRTVTQAGTMWMMQEKKNVVPANLGWVTHVFKIVKEQTEVFTCPADRDPVPIVPAMIAQHRPGYEYPTVSTDSGYFYRTVDRNNQNAYQLGFETEADVAGGDADFDDAYIYIEPATDQSTKADVWAVKAGTGRQLSLLDWRGRTLASNFSTTPRFEMPVLWGSFALNLSAAYGNFKPWHLLYVEYSDWTAVTERKLRVSTVGGAERVDPYHYGDRWYGPEYHHSGKAAVGFLDTHVEMLGKAALEVSPDPLQGSIWHPPRDPNWQPGR